MTADQAELLPSILAVIAARIAPVPLQPWPPRRGPRQPLPLSRSTPRWGLPRWGLGHPFLPDYDDGQERERIARVNAAVAQLFTEWVAGLIELWGRFGNSAALPKRISLSREVKDKSGPNRSLTSVLVPTAKHDARGHPVFDEWLDARVEVLAEAAEPAVQQDATAPKLTKDKLKDNEVAQRLVDEGELILEPGPGQASIWQQSCLLFEKIEGRAWEHRKTQRLVEAVKRVFGDYTQPGWRPPRRRPDSSVE